MQKRLIAAVIAAAFFAAAAHAQEDETGAPEERIEPQRRYVSIAAGASLFAFHGPRGSLEYPRHMRFTGAPVRAGFLAGVEGIYTPREKHRVSVGAYYEQRVAGLRIADIRYSSVFGASFLVVSAGGRFYRSSFPETALAVHCISVPLLYRYFVSDLFYLGAGIDATVQFPPTVRYTTLSIPAKASFGKYVNRVDTGARVLAGIEVKGAFLELMAAAGVLDIDSLGGKRYSMRLQALVGYRI